MLQMDCVAGLRPMVGNGFSMLEGLYTENQTEVYYAFKPK